MGWNLLADACWRPWDLHPNCLEDGSDCAVRMLLDSNVVHRKPGPKQRKRGVTAITTAPARTRAQIEADLDSIFAEAHRTGVYPYERGWREDVVTSVMLLAYAKRHGLKAFVHSAGGFLQRYVPEGADHRTPCLNWLIRDEHCYYFAGQYAHSSAAQSEVRELASRLDAAMADGTVSEAVAEVTAEVDRFLCDKEREPTFREPSRLPPMGEWRYEDSLLDDLRSGALLLTSEDSREARAAAKRKRDATRVFRNMHGTSFKESIARLEAYRDSAAGTANAVALRSGRDRNNN
jgi:hypothetical protein